MNDTIKSAIISSLITALASVLVFFLGNFSTQATLEKKTVETLSEYFDSVDKDMSYKQALQTVYEESKLKDDTINELNQQKSKEVGELNQQIDNLQNQISSTPNFEFQNASLISDGLEIQDGINKAVLVVDNNNYYSEGILGLVLKDKLSYDSVRNIVFYNEHEQSTFSETKLNLFETSALYDGEYYQTYLPSDGASFSMGNGTYTNGFTIGETGHGGFVLFDLHGEYAKINFKVGRINGGGMHNAVLKVYLNGEYVEEYSLDAQSPPIPLEINLNYANSLKLEIAGVYWCEYGFADVILSY